MAEHICELTPIDSETWETTIGVEVVRCRDCIFAQGTLSKRAKTVACTHFITIDRFENPVPSNVDPDGFCAWGKRRESE